MAPKKNKYPKPTSSTIQTYGYNPRSICNCCSNPASVGLFRPRTKKRKVIVCLLLYIELKTPGISSSLVVKVKQDNMHKECNIKIDRTMSDWMSTTRDLPFIDNFFSSSPSNTERSCVSQLRRERALAPFVQR